MIDGVLADTSIVVLVRSDDWKERGERLIIGFRTGVLRSRSRSGSWAGGGVLMSGNVILSDGNLPLRCIYSSARVNTPFSGCGRPKDK